MTETFAAKQEIELQLLGCRDVDTLRYFFHALHTV